MLVRRTLGIERSRFVAAGVCDVACAYRRLVGRGSEARRVPCGQCEACRARVAREWAWRAMAEYGEHDTASWCTLTYAPKYCPPTLVKSDVVEVIRELRRTLKFRYLGCGEYGERRSRPHYHLVAFGVGARQLRAALEDGVWRKGVIDVDDVSPAVISYVAGYVQKKCAGWRGNVTSDVQVDEHGEEFVYQPPFRCMSRMPGLGSALIRRYPDSWREHVIWNGQKVPPPRYARLVSERRMSDAELSERQYAREVDSSVSWWSKGNARHDLNSERIRRSRAAEIFLKRGL